MRRFPALCGTVLLVLVCTSGFLFGKPPTHQHRQTTSRPTQSFQTRFESSNAGNWGGGKKSFGKKKKSGKPKPSKKSGKKKHKKHKHHHKKHHKKKGSQDGGDMPDDGGDGGGDAGGGDAGGGDAGGGGPGGGDERDADDPEVASGRGLLITDLDDDGPAATAGLDVDDTILSVNGVRVQSVEELRAALKNVDRPVKLVYISDDTGDTEDVMVRPKRGRIGVTMDEIELE